MASNGTSTNPPVGNWFPIGKENWGLDAVTLLAVIGEASITENAQPMTASVLCLLPRILPAPQALLKPTRPTRLPTYNAQMVGVYNGVCLDSVGFFANIIHPLEENAPYSFRVFEIRHKDECEDGVGAVKRKGTSWSAMLLPRSTSNASGKSARRIPKPPSDIGGSENEGRSAVAFADAEKGDKASHPVPPEPTPGIKRRRTVKEQMTDFVANPMLKPSPSLEPKPRPAVPPALGSPIHIITLFSFIITLLIFGLTAYWRDGNALIAIFIVSLQASLVGYASWWKPQLMVRPPHGSDVPPGDMMIRTREGAFILVKCREEVARELYTGTEECEYHVGERMYRFCMAIGTMLLMVAVVLLGNTQFNAQALIGGSYIVLNGAYWLLGMLPKQYFWDLSRYEWEDMTPDDARHADQNAGPSESKESYASFTRTLWYAIRETRQTGVSNFCNARHPSMFLS